ncbi:PR-1-like protein [Anaeromyces robustus]|uniref:PR-1-like protein n=1 Tax=Anaeromyces robustus TaxID=1754192 RepID=A0A1Y1XCR8_9FUNG|nr:PR-1-like protein [Anaeromyces robustus]|eukprot:ORX83226.1 PR-1-like protein [Anaeromyces robustus]
MKFILLFVISVVLLVCTSVKADLTDAQKKTLLNLHKKARNAVKATNMKNISWDAKLASASQKYANQCKGMVHSGAGPENLAANTSGDVTKMFNQWLDEKADFDKSGYRSNLKGSSYNGKVVGHYSQIVWAENSKVGCGFSYCKDYKYKYLLVCRYETGNILGQEVYSKIPVSTNGKCGSSYGTRCPSGQCCSKKGRCGKSADHCAKSKGCQTKYGLCKNIKFVTN